MQSPPPLAYHLVLRAGSVASELQSIAYSSRTPAGLRAMIGGKHEEPESREPIATWYGAAIAPAALTHVAAVDTPEVAPQRIA
eukprot:scaffold304452_cov33-Tisochrysis_lutea.AAC.1